MTLIWLLAVLGAATLLVWLRGLVAPVARDRRPAHVEGTLPSSSDDVLDVLAAYLNVPVSTDNAVTPLRNGDRIFPAMLEAIGAARTHVHLLTFIYWDGDIGRRFAAALAGAARRGVDVRVLLDAYGSRKLPRSFVDRLQADGVHVAWFHPLGVFDARRVTNRTHRKVLVADGTVGFTGGVGIADPWRGDAQGEDEWRDDHFLVRGPVVRALQSAFLEDWLSATGEVLTGAGLLPAHAPAGSARAVALATSPRARWSPIAFCYWWLLRTARSQVDIATPYFVPDEELMEALLAAAHRGVRIRLLLPGSHNDSALVRWASFPFYPRLLAGGIALYEFEPTMMHSKTMTCDGQLAVIGSANFDNRSLMLNDEIALVAEDADLVAALTTSFDADLERSRRIEGAAARLPVVRRAVGRVLLVLRSLL